MLGRIQAQAFGFDQTFQPYQKDDFVTVGMGREGSLLMFLGTLHDAFLEFGSNKKCNLGFVLFCFFLFFVCLLEVFVLPALCKVLLGQSLRKDNVSALLEPLGGHGWDWRGDGEG